MCKITIFFNLQSNLEENEAENCLRVVSEQNLKEFTTDLVWHKLCKEIRLQYSPEFWSHFTPFTDENVGYAQFSRAVLALNEKVKLHLSYVRFLELLHLSSNSIPKLLKQSFLDLYKSHLSSILLSQIPKDFELTVNAFYLLSFRAFTSCEKRNNVYFGM